MENVNLLPNWLQLAFHGCSKRVGGANYFSPGLQASFCSCSLCQPHSELKTKSREEMYLWKKIGVNGCEWPKYTKIRNQCQFQNPNSSCLQSDISWLFLPCSPLEPCYHYGYAGLVFPNCLQLFSVLHSLYVSIC